MTGRPDDDCPACGEADAARYEATNAHFRIWCSFCNHSTQQYADLDLARLEWLGSGDALS